MRNLSFRKIETLLAIAEAGSLVQAAAALNMTPAALTARVRGLEDAVALKLFDRTATGMRLTKAARRRSRPRAASSERCAISPMRCVRSARGRPAGDRIAQERRRRDRAVRAAAARHVGGELSAGAASRRAEIVPRQSPGLGEPMLRRRDHAFLRIVVNDLDAEVPSSRRARRSPDH